MNKYIACIISISIVCTLFLVGCGATSSTTTIGTSQPIFLTPTPTSTPTPMPTAVPLPDDIVVYPGAQLVVSQPITTGTLYFYRSTAALDDVTTYYVNQMPQKGWTQTSAQLNGSQGNFLVYMKGSRSVRLNVVPDPLTAAQTDITITTSDT